MMSKSSFPSSSLIFSTILWNILLCLCSSKGTASLASPTHGNESDLATLQNFKSLISEDPKGIMKLWNGSSHFCGWFGVTCGPRNQRVVILNLENQSLVGSLPLSVGNLTLLEGINLRNNVFGGKIPQEIGRLRYLRHINLTQNSFVGKIPTNISNCRDLIVLDITYNQLVGTIPNQLSLLLKLTRLSFGANNLTGTIPSWIGNLSSLSWFSLGLNNLYGNIPEELGRLKNLERLVLLDNNLSGIVPQSIYNISSMNYFTIAKNQLIGGLPKNIATTLPNLAVFSCAVNKLTGNIPLSLPNASRLQVVDFAQNRFTGSLPLNLGSLRELSWLNFDQNMLGTGKSGDMKILRSLANCTSLRVLGIARNFLGGELPKSIANLSTNLEILTAGQNSFHGDIPNGFGNLVNLTVLGLEGNELSGTIPDEIGKLKNLRSLHLQGNKFSGPIPYSISNLTSLTRLFLEDDRLEGTIPASLGRCQSLLILNLSSNYLSGNIPGEIMKIPQLSLSLTLSNNSFTGSLPPEVGELDQLSELDVSGNKLSGRIPSSLGKCVDLGSLHLENNQFDGNIPESLESLKGLVEIDLSYNNLSGMIPEFLSKLSALKLLNLSYNNFKGELSTEGIFSNASGISIIGNDRLCGGIKKLRLRTCHREKEAAFRKVVILAICLALLLIIILGFFIFCLVSRHSKRRPFSTIDDLQGHVSYSDIAEATNGFSEENLIGSGSFGSVYKGVLCGDTKLVAIKVLNLQQQGASKSFIDECKALKSVKHRNLLKIITACSSIDRQGKDFKSLVFEYMENGNLDEWLHPKFDVNSKRLSFIQRLNIAIDVAHALDYLHNYCETPIVHCDLKPSNVLLDRDLVAHVGDFGLASFLFDTLEKATLTVGLKGSIGYVPPEYGMGGKASVLGDCYGFGILLLEIFTGKRPTHDMFKDGIGIHKLALMASSEHVMDIVDPSLLLVEEDSDEYTKGNESDIEEKTIMKDRNNQASGEKRLLVYEECMVSVMRVGVLSSNELPKERLPIGDAVNELLSIKDSFMKSTSKTTGKK